MSRVAACSKVGEAAAQSSAMLDSDRTVRPCCSPRSKAAASLRSAPGSSVSGGPASEEGDSSGEEAGGGTQALRLLVRLLVPQPLCGVIIGKSGTTIRNYAADTGTVIRVTSGEAAQLPTSHRIVTIAGEKEGVLKVGGALHSSRGKWNTSDKGLTAGKGCTPDARL